MWMTAEEVALEHGANVWVIDSYDYHLWEVVQVEHDRILLGHPFEHFEYPLTVLFIGDYKFLVVEEVK